MGRAVNLIGITGAAGSGKDTVADILVRNHSFVRVALADPMKRFCKEVFGFTDEQLWGPSEKRNEVDDRWPRPREPHRLDENGKCHVCFEVYPPSEEACFGGDMYLSPRVALQQLGTQWGRAMSEDVWINKALDIASQLLIGEKYRWHAYEADRGLIDRGEALGPEKICGVIFPDIRYPNELNAIRAKGGHIWHKEGAGSLSNSAAAMHSSETSLRHDYALRTIPWLDDVAGLEEIVKELMTP